MTSLTLYKSYCQLTTVTGE